MMLVELTTIAPASLPVEAFREHLRLGSGFAADDLQGSLLEQQLRAAIASIEGRTGKILIERDFSWTIFVWRDARRQPLPLAPVSRIGGVFVSDGQGAEQAIPETMWRLEPDFQRPMLLPKASSLPVIPAQGSARVVMTAGFGPGWDTLPADLAQAVLILAAHFYEFRHEAKVEGLSIPYGVTALIERYRTVRTFMGNRS